MESSRLSLRACVCELGGSLEVEFCVVSAKGGRSVHTEWCVGVWLAGVRLEGVCASEGRRGRCFSLFWTWRVRVSVSPALLASDLML